jgi:hypothetical protein
MEIELKQLAEKAKELYSGEVHESFPEFVIGDLMSSLSGSTDKNDEARIRDLSETIFKILAHSGPAVIKDIEVILAKNS